MSESADECLSLQYIYEHWMSFILQIKGRPQHLHVLGPAFKSTWQRAAYYTESVTF